MPVVAEGAFERAAGVGQRFWAPVNHAKRTRDDAVPAAVANVILHEHRTDFGANNRARRTRFEATSFVAVLADIRKENPAKRVIPIARP